MLISQSSLAAVLKSNVCEIRFLRRRLRFGRPPYRRMVCTNSNQLLLGVDGRLTLNYTPPRSLPGFNPADKNVVIAWDVLMQDFRAINCDRCDLIKTVPANEDFWNYFKETLMILTPGQKTAFMDS